MDVDPKVEKKRQKAATYASQPERFALLAIEVELTSNHGVRRVAYADGAWSCSCEFYRDRRTCSHIMAVEKLLKSADLENKGVR